MKKIKQITLCMLVSIALINYSYAQKADTSKAKDNTPHIYFIIKAGTEINAFYNDKPVQASTLDDFNTYVQTNVKSLRDSWVIVTGKPKTGTFDEVMKTLKRNRFKHISTNIQN
ncbi:MAG: hypothetical protein JST75_21945 [Bacteroidetes bacterium]|nr:hypothetical protein [Bacteroidota bacterium]